MDELEQARAYAQADFDEPNASFVAHFADHFPDFTYGTVADLGCGPGDIALRFARRWPNCIVHGLDGSTAMLGFAAEVLRGEPELHSRVQFVLGRLPGVPMPLARYDAVVSNSLLHHLPDPAVLWNSVRELGADGARVLVMDLCRPATPVDAQATVEAYAGGEPEILKRDFFYSLCAAFEPGEVEQQLEQCGLRSLSVEVVSDRHMLISGRLTA
jgi:ubiquinone/menaquinone biosynthesis C-methylase UbiE